MKLICLTYAGGNKYSYRNLQSHIDDSITLVTLELPGRGSRMTESLIEDLNDLTDDLYRQIQPYLGETYILYGHSMGAMLGNLLIHKLHSENKALPIRFIATGCASPKTRHLRRQLHPLSDHAFQQELKKLGGMPEEVIGNQELLDYVTPILRSDIKAIETHDYIDKPKYSVPLMVIYGSDEGLEQEDIIDWKDETSGGFKQLSLSGGHFFINNHLPFIANIINVNLIDTVRSLASVAH